MARIFCAVLVLAGCGDNLVEIEIPAEAKGSKSEIVLVLDGRDGSRTLEKVYAASLDAPLVRIPISDSSRGRHRLEALFYRSTLAELDIANPGRIADDAAGDPLPAADRVFTLDLDGTDA